MPYISRHSAFTRSCSAALNTHTWRTASHSPPRPRALAGKLGWYGELTTIWPSRSTIEKGIRRPACSMPADELGAGNVNIASRPDGIASAGANLGVVLSSANDRHTAPAGPRTLSQPVMVDWTWPQQADRPQYASSTPPPAADQRCIAVHLDWCGRRRRLWAHDGRIRRPPAPQHYRPAARNTHRRDNYRHSVFPRAVLGAAGDGAAAQHGLLGASRNKNG